LVDTSAVEKFRKSVQGAVLAPGQEGYDAVRTVPNAMIDRRPALIVRCTGAADVIASVHFAREHDLVVAVRGGGHSVAGKSVCDGGLMIDMSPMKGIRVDPRQRTARAQTGLVLGEFDHEVQAFGLATTLGVVSRTGIAGLTLGGGWGHLHAKFGLALDNVISADVVIADGRLLTTNGAENSDLFWGIRGGSGNFGIVTSLEYRLHPLGPVLAGAVFHHANKTREAIHFFRDYAETIPDELVIQCGAFTLPDGTRVLGIAACYCGPPSEGEKLLKPLRDFGPPMADAISVMSYRDLQQMFDPFFPPGRLTYVKSNFIRDLNDDAIQAIADPAGTSPSPTALRRFWSTGMEQLPACQSVRLPSHTASTPTTSCSGQTGRISLSRRKTFSGPVTAGRQCSHFSWKAHTVTTSPTKEMCLPAPPMAPTMKGSPP